MRQFLTGIILFGLISFAGNCFAQDAKIDAEVAKYTGQTIMEYLHLPDFGVLPDSNARRYCTDESCFYYTGNHVVFVRVFAGDPGAENELPKAKYKQMVDQYNSLLTRLGDAGNQEKDTDERTLFTWHGVHTTITAIINKDSKLISLTFTDNDLAPK